MTDRVKYFRINSNETVENLKFTGDKAYRLWKKWMKLGEKTGCHQRADRSFYVKGYQLPVCARCTGVIIGYLIAVPIFFLLGFSKTASISGMLALFTDWLLQASEILESTNRRRLATGIAGGFGAMSFQLLLIKKLIKFFSKAS